RSELADEVLHPALLQRSAVGDVRVVRIVPGDVLAGALLHAVAGVGIPLPIGAGLSTVLRLGEARELAAARAELRDPVDHRHADHRLRTGVSTRGDECV